MHSLGVWRGGKPSSDFAQFTCPNREQVICEHDNDPSNLAKKASHWDQDILFQSSETEQEVKIDSPECQELDKTWKLRDKDIPF